MKRIRLITIMLIGLIILPFKINASSLVSNIEVEGVGPLNLSKKTWNLGFSTSLDYVNVTATPADTSVKVEGDGKINIQEGNNTITITATNGGQTETYTINLNVTKSAGNITNSSVSYDKDGNEVKNPSTGAFMNYTFIIMASLAVLVILLKSNTKKKFYRI